METKKFIGVLVGVILVLVLGLGIGYYVGDSNKEVVEKDSVPTENNDDYLREYANELFEEVYIRDSGEELALWYPILWDTFQETKPKVKVATYKDLPDDSKFLITMGNIKNIIYEVGDYKTNISDPGYCSMRYLIDYEVFMETYHKIFGSNNDFVFSDEGYYVAYNNKCQLESGDYKVINCRKIEDISASNSRISYMALDSATKEGDSIILNIKGYTINDEERVHSFKEEHIVDQYFNKVHWIRKTDYDLVNKYGDLMDDYTITFVKDTNGNYYFKELRYID